MNVFEDDFETWSPEGSPSRTPEYMLGGHNPLEPRIISNGTMGLSTETPVLCRVFS